MGEIKKAMSVTQLTAKITKLHFGGLIVRDAPADAYRVRLGWYHKGKTDMVLAEAAALLAAETTTDIQRGQIYWTRSFFLWDLQRFEHAASDVDAFLAISTDVVYRKTGQKNLAAMKKCKLPHEML